MKVYFNSTGYYITGNETEVSMSCSPSLDRTGNRLYTDAQHLYVVLAKALNEIRGKDTEEITVFNDSRVIDEMNGVVAPLDDFCKEMCLGIRRSLLPELSGNVFFRKHNSHTLEHYVSGGHDAMIKVDNKFARLKDISDREESEHMQNKVKALHRLKAEMSEHMRKKYAD